MNVAITASTATTNNQSNVARAAGRTASEAACEPRGFRVAVSVIRRRSWDVRVFAKDGARVGRGQGQSSIVWGNAMVHAATNTKSKVTRILSHPMDSDTGR